MSAHRLSNENLHTRTKLSPYDIVDLISICLSSSDFLYADRHHTTNDSGPIGLSLMVTLSQLWMVHTMDEAIKIARSRGCVVPRLITIYMDDIWSVVLNPPPRTGLRSNSTPRDPMNDFQNCLNAVHQRVQFTRENEENRSIPFLDVLITREDDGKLTTKIYRKPSNTNIVIKPQSCQDPNTAVTSFKGELCRCYRLCSSEESIRNEIKFLLDLFEDNGHCRSKFEEIAQNYKPPTLNARKNKTKQKATTPSTATETETRNLFEILPFGDEKNENEEERKNYACITYIPGISHQLKRALAKAGVNTVFKSGPKLKDILCAGNTTKRDPCKKKGVYKYTCPCDSKSTYVGQTSRSFELRWEEHNRAIQHKQWAHSGLTQHYEQCQKPFNKDHFEVLTKHQDKNKRRLMYDIKIREALEIRRHNSGPGKGLNEDIGAYVKTDLWDPVLHQIGNK